MDKDRDDVLKELNVSHHKITSFLKDVYGEWNHYKNIVHNLKSKFSHLLNEYERVCNENKSLNKKNEKLNVLILNCIHFISDIDYSKTNSDEFLKFALESIKQNFINEISFKENLNLVSSHSECVVEDCEPKKNSSRRPLLDAEDTKNECKDVNLILMENKYECPMERMGKFVQSKESSYKNSLWSQKKPNVKVVNDNDEGRKLTVDAKNGRKEKSLQEAQRENFSFSPEKRGWSERETREDSPKSEGYFLKKCKRKAGTNCRSPRSAAKKNISKEDDGAKKMTQTLLNIDVFKIKTPVKDKVSDVDSPCSSKVPTQVQDGDEDDLIWESPRSTAEKDRIRGARDAASRLEPVSLSPGAAMDLDETYAPPELVETVEKRSKAFSDERRPKSPEYDSVPLMYRRDGRLNSSCSDSDLYYKEPVAYDSEKDEKFNKGLSSVFYCSKHRKKHDRKPELEDTPPGYWKPFLTNSIICSPTDDDA